MFKSRQGKGQERLRPSRGEDLWTPTYLCRPSHHSQGGVFLAIKALLQTSSARQTGGLRAVCSSPLSSIKAVIVEGEMPRVEQQVRWEEWRAGQARLGQVKGAGKQSKGRPLAAKGTMSQTWQWWGPTGLLLPL